MSHSWVFIDEFRVDASIGVYEWEKQIKQTLLFDLEMACDITHPANTDTLENAVDYAAVCQLIKDTVLAQHFGMLECLAERLAEQILEQFPVENLSLRISKPGAIADAQRVGVLVKRGGSVQ